MLLGDENLVPNLDYTNTHFFDISGSSYLPLRQRRHWSRQLVSSPEVVHTNRGKTFHNELVSELLRMSGIEQSFTTAYSSEENGIVDRTNQELLRHLNAILFVSRVHDKWSSEQLPMVQRIMNTVEKTSTGVSPATAIMNDSIRLSERILLPQFRKVFCHNGRLGSKTKHPKEKQSQTDFHAMVEYDPAVTEYPVHRLEEATSYSHDIEDLVSGKRTTTHIHNLRPFNYDPDRTSPLEVAQQNEKVFAVEAIIGHRGNRNRRSTMEFKVRWARFDAYCDSWEPYNALLHVDKLHDYLTPCNRNSDSQGA